MLKCVNCIAGVGIPYSPEKESVRNGAAMGGGKGDLRCEVCRSSCGSGSVWRESSLVNCTFVSKEGSDPEEG